MKDKRYEVTKEFCGYAKAQYVVRFCGGWITCFEKREDAETFVKEIMK